jgi:hypothetical protein
VDAIWGFNLRDEADEEQRLLPYFLSRLGGESRSEKLEPGWFEAASEMAHGTLALTLTAAGIPMFLAGDEFGDLHDSDRKNWMLKMSDPVDWERSTFPGDMRGCWRESASWPRCARPTLPCTGMKGSCSGVQRRDTAPRFPSDVRRQ